MSDVAQEILVSPIGIIVALICAILFFIVDLYNESKTKEIHSSVIAGISVAYFFLIVLPEISENIPEYPLQLRMLEYLFVLIGFTFIHVSEKYILQHVDRKAQEKIKTLFQMEKNLDLVETEVSHIIKKQLSAEELDSYAIQDLARIMSDLIEQEEVIKEQDFDLKHRIQSHINEDLDNIHQFTNYVYQFLEGLILVYLLFIDFLTALLFFLFAFFEAITTKTSNDVILFPGVPAGNENKKPQTLTYFLATAVLMGILFGLISAFYFPITLEVLYVLFSFISGVILYIIVREVIPEKEQGKPLYFLIGVISFFFFVLIAQYLGYSLLIE